MLPPLKDELEEARSRIRVKKEDSNVIEH